MKRFFYEEDLTTSLNLFNINPKKFMIKRIAVTLAIIILALGLLVISILYSLIFLILAIAYYKFEYYILKDKIKRNIMIKINQFSIFLKYFLALLPSSSNVFYGLMACSNYLDEPIKTLVEDLAKKINLDKSPQPFLDFATEIKTLEATQIMMLIYEFNLKGYEEESLIELVTIVEKIQENNINVLLTRKLGKLDFPPLLVLFAVITNTFLFSLSAIISALKGIGFSVQ